MKVLCAIAAELLPAKERRKNDFNWAEPGEIVDVSTVCDGGAAHRNKCGCGRSFSGFESMKATTYAAVVELDADEVKRDHDEGRRKQFGGMLTEAEIEAMWAEFVEVHAQALRPVKVGAVVRVTNNGRIARYLYTV